MQKTPRGWTLIELLIAIAVLGIVSGFAVTSLNGMVQAAHGSAARGAMLESLTRARNAATLREQDVRICPSTDGATCADSYHWESGWIVYADVDDDNRKGPADVVIGGYPKLADGVRLITSTGRRTIEFQPSGGNGGNNATFTLCDGRGPGRASAFAMANTGGLREVKPSATAVTEACYP